MGCARGDRGPVGPVVVALALLAVNGCSATARAPGAAQAPHAAPPPSGARFDYQLGGPYPPAEGVTVVVRDRTAPPAGLGYDVCYVNGFQTQPADSAAFAAAHPDLVVQTGDGPLSDPGWPDELLFDTSTAARRAELVALVGPWIDGCAASGYDAVELDDLDSWTRSRGHLTAADNTALAVELVRVAHAAGLAVAQKNAPEQSGRLRAAGYDFAVAESCAVHDECGAYSDHYPVVLDVEYTDELGADRFEELCAGPGADDGVQHVLRDHDLLVPGADGHAYDACGS